MSRLKAQLLLEASQKNTHVYYQFDGFLDAQADSLVHPDEDDDALFVSVTPELRRGGIDVRIQVLAGTRRKDAVRIAKKMVRWMERDVDWKGMKKTAKLSNSPGQQTDLPF